jgi:hypothetical protein
MAVIEIAKIQIRRGQEATTGMPQLDSGEFGWAEDTEHLYIGKRIVDGAINDENTRILTQGDLDNVFTLLANTTTNITYYRYRNQAPWIHSSGTNVQTKLDTLVSLVDYGVVPVTTTTSTVVDITVQFQNAVADIFNNPTAVADARRELLVPAGNYAISNVINLPPYTVLKGAGSGLTNLILQSTTTNMFRTIGVDQAGTEYTWDSGSGTLSAAYRPQDIRIEGMTLSYGNTLTQAALVSLDNVYNSKIRDVIFSSTSTTYSAGVGVDIRGQGGSFALSRINDGFTQNIEITDCQFTGMNIGVRGTGTVVRPIIDSNIFTNLNQGISFYTQDTFPGPSDGLITKNRFHQVVKEGFYVGANPGQFRSNHLSKDNFYGYVGNGHGFNDYQTTSTTFYPVYINALSTSGSGVNTFVVNTVTYTAFKNIDVSKAYWYATTSTVNGVYSQITGTVVTTPTTLQFYTTSSLGSVDYTNAAITFGYIETTTPAVNFQSFGNRTENDVFARKILADQGPGSIVESINVLNVDSMGPYATTATITISPPDLVTGVPAKAYPVVDEGGTITQVIITDHGYGYQSVPTITVSGLTAGTPAQFRVNLVDQFWYTPYVEGNATINDTSNYTVTMTPGSSADMAKLPITGNDQQINIQYQLSSESLSRKGNILLNIAPDGYVSFNENYNYLTDVVTINTSPLVPQGPSGVDVLYVSTANNFIDTIPTPPTNYFVVGSGVYNDLAAQIISTSTSVVAGTKYYVIYTQSSNPQFDYSTTNTNYNIGFTESVQPSFSWVTSNLNNYIKLSCFNPSAVTTATLEYQVNIHLL